MPALCGIRMSGCYGTGDLDDHQLLIDAEDAAHDIADFTQCRVCPYSLDDRIHQVCVAFRCRAELYQSPLDELVVPLGARPVEAAKVARFALRVHGEERNCDR